MAISAEERRFLRYWEEQSKGGKWSFVPLYGLGYFFIIFMCGVVLGFFLNLPFVRVKWLVMLAIIALVGGIVLSLVLWHRQGKRFRQIIRREAGEF